MEIIRKLETLIAGWLKSVPHLPKNGQKWIAENAWWIVLIGVIVSGVALLTMLIGVLTAVAFVGTTASYYGYVITQSYTGWWLVSAIVSLILLALSTVLMALAIGALRGMRHKGWMLLFASLLVSAISVIVGVILSFNPVGFVTGLIFGAIWIAVGTYFLFEIRGYFGAGKKTSATPSTK